MKNKVLILIITLVVWNKLLAQKSSDNLIIYKNSEKKYSIQYPENWQVKEHKDGVVSIKFNEVNGGFYISTYEKITFSDDYMKDFILESNQLSPDLKQNILSGEDNGIKSWYVSYTNPKNNLICISMYKRKTDKLWFVSSEIDSNLWKNGWKERIIKILSTFEIKDNN